MEFTFSTKAIASEDDMLMFETEGIVSIDYKGVPVIIGKIEMTLAKFKSIVHEGYDPLEYFKVRSDHLFELYVDFYKKKGTGYKKRVLKGKNPELNTNFIYLDKIEIVKEFRHFGIGQELFDKALRSFCFGYGIVVLVPFPTQIYDPSVIIDDLDGDFRDLPTSKKASKKCLVSMYKDWGFEKLKGSRFYFMDIEDYLLNHCIIESDYIFYDGEEKDLIKKYIKRAKAIKA